VSVFIESGFGGSQVELNHFLKAREGCLCEAEENVDVIFLSGCDLFYG
jgi:hypothetical protein